MNSPPPKKRKLQEDNTSESSVRPTKKPRVTKPQNENSGNDSTGSSSTQGLLVGPKDATITMSSNANDESNNDSRLSKVLEMWKKGELKWKTTEDKIVKELLAAIMKEYGLDLHARNLRDLERQSRATGGDPTKTPFFKPYIKRAEAWKREQQELLDAKKKPVSRHSSIDTSCSFANLQVEI